MIWSQNQKWFLSWTAHESNWLYLWHSYCAFFFLFGGRQLQYSFNFIIWKRAKNQSWSYGFGTPFGRVNNHRCFISGWITSLKKIMIRLKKWKGGEGFHTNISWDTEWKHPLCNQMCKHPQMPKKKNFFKVQQLFFGREHIQVFIYIPYINSGVFGAIPALFTFLSDSISAHHHAPS